jgi:hypothetical protein
MKQSGSRWQFQRSDCRNAPCIGHNYRTLPRSADRWRGNANMLAASVIFSMPVHQSLQTLLA